MDDLIAFLRARLDEDAEEAQQAGGAAWMPLTIPRFSSPGDRGEIEIGEEIVAVPTPDVALHMALHDPARVLREIDAKQKIIAAHFPVDPCDAHDAASETIPCDTLLLLALPYSDHPDYRDAWRP